MYQRFAIWYEINSQYLKRLPAITTCRESIWSNVQQISFFIAVYNLISEYCLLPFDLRPVVKRRTKKSFISWMTWQAESSSLWLLPIIQLRCVFLRFSRLLSQPQFLLLLNSFQFLFKLFWIHIVFPFAPVNCSWSRSISNSTVTILFFRSHTSKACLATYSFSSPLKLAWIPLS